MPSHESSDHVLLIKGTFNWDRFKGGSFFAHLDSAVELDGRASQGLHIEEHSVLVCIGVEPFKVFSLIFGHVEVGVGEGHCSSLALEEIG